MRIGGGAIREKAFGPIYQLEQIPFGKSPEGMMGIWGRQTSAEAASIHYRGSSGEWWVVKW